ncbi:MAG TPA: hypothetical protein VK192_14250, partial [Sphingomicrobium sp.]|nr:hypothetical protein [Sphingomicrobium sp.]
PLPWSDEVASGARIREARPVDAVALHQLYAAVTPLPIQFPLGLLEQEHLEPVRVTNFPGDLSWLT